MEESFFLGGQSVSRIAKLYEKLLDGRPISFSELQLLLAAFGFTLDRVKGSHHIYRHPRLSQRINIQPVGKDAKPYQLRQFLDMIEEAGLTLEDRK